MRDRVVVTFKPYGGPRRKVTFEPASSVDEWEYEYWRIEEVYETDAGHWRETGREHVTEPDIVIESEGLPERAAPTQEVEPDA
jgi:hypothetical protein